MERLILFLRSWIEEKPEVRNATVLGKKAEVAPSTVRRVLQGEQIPTENTCRKLLRVTAESADIFLDLLSEAFPEIDYLKSLRTEAFEGVTDNYFNWYKRDSLSFEIFIATANDDGYAYDDLIKSLGAHARVRIAELLEDSNSGVRLEGERIYTDRIMFTSYESILDLGGLSADFVKKNLDNFKASYFYCNRYTQEELREIGDSIKDLMSTVNTINARVESKSKRELAQQPSVPTVIYLSVGSLSAESK